jgi:hypothetical protein
VEVSPDPGDIEADHNDTLTFELSIVDPDMDPVNITWFVEKVPLGDGTRFNLSLEEMNITEDTYLDLEVNISVGSLYFDYNWTVHVMPPEEPEEPEPVPPVNVSIGSPRAGSKYYTNDTITFNANDEDDRDLTYRWLINGSFYEGKEVTVSGLGPGDHTAILNVSTDGPPPGWTEVSITFRVLVYKEEVEEPVYKDEPFSWWWIVLVLVIAAIVIAVVVFLIIRGNGGGGWEEE